MQIRHVRVRVLGARMLVRMGVLAVGHRIVRVVVMTIVVAMGVLVDVRIVHVRMLVLLAEMEDDADEHR
ncbi:MAG TPA: hypothetical protein VIF62_30885, partial [Labilithrix sp.]